MDKVMLSEWLKEFEPQFILLGHKVRGLEEWDGNCTSVTIETSNLLGRVCHWPDKTFEFQFMSRSTGEVLLIDTLELDSAENLSEHILKVISEFKEM